MEAKNITVDDLLRKIGAMTIQLEVAQATIAQLEERIAQLVAEQKAENNSVDK